MYISSNGWSLSLDLNGGRIGELSHKGITVFGTYNRIDGKQGNTHLCVPSFDKEGSEKYNLPFHGLVRNTLWKLEKMTANEVDISVVTEATKTYPASLKVSQSFLLGETFEQAITVEHLSGQPVPINIGIHYYWATPEGWKQTKIHNQNQKENIETNGYIDLHEKNTIVFPHASYELVSNGFNAAVLWTSFKTDEEGKKQYSQDFCCIEPVIGWPQYFGDENSLLKAGEKKVTAIKLCAGERT